MRDGARIGLGGSGAAIPEEDRKGPAGLAINLAHDAFAIRFLDNCYVCTVRGLGTGDPPFLTELDRLIAEDPDNPYYRFARSEARVAIHRPGDSVQQDLDRAGAGAPEDLDIRMRREYPDLWDNLFFYPSWDAEAAKIPAAMLEAQAAGNPLQIVRRGLRLGVTILVDAETAALPPDIAETRWRPVWAETPHGPLLAHYVILVRGDGTHQRQEMMVAPWPVEPPHARNGNWLIERLAQLDSIDIAFNDGPNLTHVHRHAITPQDRQVLDRARASIATLPPDGLAGFESAMQWYFDNSSLEDIR